MFRFINNFAKSRQNCAKLFYHKSNVLFAGSRVCYAEPQNLTEMVREVLKDKKPIASASVKTGGTTPTDNNPDNTEDIKKRSKI